MPPKIFCLIYFKSLHIGDKINKFNATIIKNFTIKFYYFLVEQSKFVLDLRFSFTIKLFQASNVAKIIWHVGVKNREFCSHPHVILWLRTSKKIM